LLGFMGMILCGAIYEILPRIMHRDLPFPKLAKASYFCFGIGVLVYALPLMIGGVVQGIKLGDPSVPFADVSALVLLFIRASSLGQLGLLVGALFLLLNVLVLTVQWKLGLLKFVIAAVKAPLSAATGAPAPLSTSGEVKS
jgi:cytochrome c oxidase cbb3-type subunit 1